MINLPVDDAERRRQKQLGRRQPWKEASGSETNAHTYIKICRASKIGYKKENMETAN